MVETRFAEKKRGGKLATVKSGSRRFGGTTTQGREECVYKTAGEGDGGKGPPTKKKRDLGTLNEQAERPPPLPEAVAGRVGIQHSGETSKKASSSSAFGRCSCLAKWRRRALIHAKASPHPPHRPVRRECRFWRRRRRRRSAGRRQTGESIRHTKPTEGDGHSWASKRGNSISAAARAVEENDL
ncbi:hypothetical protein MRX96_015671 [Rhipicephalus microplus]